MKVLHYIPSISRAGGGVSAYLQLLSYSLGKIVELHIISHHTKDELILENCHIHFIEGRLKHPIKMKHEYWALLDEIQPNIVHVNGCWMLQCSWTVFWARSKGYPVIISPHGMLEPWNIKKNYWTKKLPALLMYQKRSIKVCQMLVATAETEMKNLIDLGYNSNITVVPNGLTIDGIKIKDSWKERKQILFLALFRRNKGIDILMQAISQMKYKLKGWKVIVAGIESDYTINDLKTISDELKISEIINVVGPLFGEEKWKAYRESDVFILPTLNENFGIVIAESLICGTPVITTKGAPWPQIPKYKCGWWINRSIYELTQAIDDFIKTPIETRKTMGINGRKLIEENFTSDIVARKMVEVYKKVANSYF
ncbi:glycosyltransferase [Phocaeicola sp.]